MLRLAAQVQARIQQRAAAEGQSKQLLESTHGRNLAAPSQKMQGSLIGCRHNCAARLGIHSR